MPWTFAHPAAVLPLKRLCPRWLNFPALLIGTMMPDLSYYIPGTDFSAYAHTLAGCLVICLPCGLVILGLLYALRVPLVHLLPQPHRQLMTPLARARATITPALAAALALSIVIGALTHLAWDSLTHGHSLAVEHLDWLRAPLIEYRRYAMPVYQALQHLSTVLGVALLIWAYGRSLRGIDAVEHTAASRWRERTLWCIAALAFAGAFWMALNSIIGVRPNRLPGVFAREMVIQGAVLFAGLYALCAVVAHRFTKTTPP